MVFIAPIFDRLKSLFSEGEEAAPPSKVRPGDVLRKMGYGVLSPPVPIVRVAQRLGIDVVPGVPPDPQWDRDGRPWSSLVGRKIWVREDDEEPYRRLAVAHGLAHLLLHEGNHYCAWDGDRGLKDGPETEALGYSAEYLVPFFMLRRYAPIAIRRRDPDPVPTFAEMFAAPEWLVRIQTRRLGYPW